ncbi:MAG: YeeE/YedE family protein [Spirochaetaceae bacterium]|nr:MAG: YeeE/YedE family protein [Spirochaetaceae bacterium]
MMDVLMQPWPWYVTGPLLGLMVPLLLFLGNKEFGVSSSLQHMCAATLPLKAGYFRYNWRDSAWNLVMMAGLILGAAIATIYLDGASAPALSEGGHALFASWGLEPVTELQPREIFALESIATPRALISLILGGFLVGFGARYANGCTSGHAIMGLSLLKPGSLVAVIGFFIGGLLVSHFVLPWVMTL